MKLLFPIEVNLSQLIKLITPKRKEKPVVHNQIGSNPVDVEEPFWNYHLSRAEPADAVLTNPWAIE